MIGLKEILEEQVRLCFKTKIDSELQKIIQRAKDDFDKATNEAMAEANAMANKLAVELLRDMNKDLTLTLTVTGRKR